MATRSIQSASQKAPFPWFGGKSRIASDVWQRFGNVPNYVEPFAGSLAVLLKRPSLPKVETVNDADCYLANFWRALKNEPDAVAEYADWPVNEADLCARKKWLVSRREWVAQIKTDPDFYDAKIAGWWVWGVGQSIGDSWCGMEDVSEIPNLGSSGTGIHRSSLPHLGNPGTGIRTYLCALSDRLRRVRVVCGNWTRVLTPSVTIKHGLTGVFLDPPYDGFEDIYTGTRESGFSFREVEEWAYENGNSPEFRIALCGYDLKPPARWEIFKWRASPGYGIYSQNRFRETIVFSPYCIHARNLWEAV